MSDHETGLILYAGWALNTHDKEVIDFTLKLIQKRGIEIPPELELRRLLYNLEESVLNLSYSDTTSFDELLTQTMAFDVLLEDSSSDKYSFFHMQREIVRQGALSLLAQDFLRAGVVEPASPSDIMLPRDFKEQMYTRKLEDYFEAHRDVYEEHPAELDADIKRFTTSLYADTRARGRPPRMPEPVLVLDFFISNSLSSFKNKVSSYYRQLIGRSMDDPLKKMQETFQAPVALQEHHLAEPDFDTEEATRSGPYAKPSSSTPQSSVRRSQQSVEKERKKSMEPGDLEAASKNFKNKYDQVDPLNKIISGMHPPTEPTTDEDFVATQLQEGAAKLPVRSPITRARSLATGRSNGTKIEFNEEMEDIPEPPTPPEIPRRSNTKAKTSKLQSDDESEEDVQALLHQLARTVEGAKKSGKKDLPSTLASPPRSSKQSSAKKRKAKDASEADEDEHNGSASKMSGQKRRKWTHDETNALEEGVKRYGEGRWTDILKDPDFRATLKSRTNVQLKDKYRNILKEREDEEEEDGEGGKDGAQDDEDS